MSHTYYRVVEKNKENVGEANFNLSWKKYSFMKLRDGQAPHQVNHPPTTPTIPNNNSPESQYKVSNLAQLIMLQVAADVF